MDISSIAVLSVFSRRQIKHNVTRQSMLRFNEKEDVLPPAWWTDDDGDLDTGGWASWRMIPTYETSPSTRISRTDDDGASLYPSVPTTVLFQVTQIFWRGISNPWKSILVWLRVFASLRTVLAHVFSTKSTISLFFPPFTLLSTTWRGILYISLLSTNRRELGALPSWQNGR